MALANHFRWYFGRCYEELNKLSKSEIYNVLHNKLSEDSSEASVPFFFSAFDEKRKEVEALNKKYKSIFNKFTARVDVKLIPKTEKGEFQIFSVSDDKANVWKPNWFQKNGIGYQIQSCAGQLDFIAKATIDGQIKLWLRGVDVHSPENKSKRVPYWIDYSKLIVNGKNIFNKIMPAWHDKPYYYNLDVTAGDEITIVTKWQPHRSDA